MLDHILAILLIAVIPARALWRSRARPAAPRAKSARYRETIAMVAGLLGLLAINWVATGRTVEALGLAVPSTMPALTCFGVTLTLLVVLAITIAMRPAVSTDTAGGAALDMLPETPAEFRLYAVFTVVAGFGWELLYRGFLLRYLSPQIGLPAGVAVAALAYGVGHGFKSAKQFVVSLISAFAFTIGYALTANLWWLIALHIGLPVIGILASRRYEPVSQRS